MFVVLCRLYPSPFSTLNVIQLKLCIRQPPGLGVEAEASASLPPVFPTPGRLVSTAVTGLVELGNLLTRILVRLEKKKIDTKKKGTGFAQKRRIISKFDGQRADLGTITPIETHPYIPRLGLGICMMKNMSKKTCQITKFLCQWMPHI